MSTDFPDVSPLHFKYTGNPQTLDSAQALAEAHMQEEMILEDPLNGLQEVGSQGQRVLQRFLPLPEELGQHLVPHTLG